MNPRNALNMLKQAAEKFLGTMEDHLNLQEAVKTVEDLVSKVESGVLHESTPTPETPAEPAAETPAEPVEPEA